MKQYIYIAIDEYAGNSKAESYLPALKSERDEIRDILRNKEILNLKGIDVRAEALNSWQEVIRDINTFSKELTIFHFAGHGNSKELLMNNERIKAETIFDGLNIANETPNLKLVFFNACSTKEQVKYYFEKNVAVIASHIPIPDTKAKNFACRFYKYLISGNTIKSSFDNAISGENEIGKNFTFRTLGEAEGTDYKNKEIWGLFCNNDDILNWKIERGLSQINQGNLIDPNFSTDCDREVYEDYFINHYNLGKQNHKNIYHYFVLGEEKHAPISLSRKLIFKQITEKFKNETFFQSDREVSNPFFRAKNDDNLLRLTKSTNHIITTLYDDLTQKESETLKNFDDLSKISQFLNKKFILIYIVVESKYWSSLSEKIQQFIKESETTTLKQEKRFFFLWNIFKKPQGFSLFNSSGKELPTIFKQIVEIEKSGSVCLLNNWDKDNLIENQEEADKYYSYYSGLQMPLPEDFKNWIINYNRITAKENSINDMTKPLKEIEIEFEQWINKYNTEIISNKYGK